MTGSNLTAALRRIGSRYDRLLRTFNGLLARVRRHAPNLDVRLRVGERRDFSAKRDYAYCSWDGDRATITVAPKMLNAALHRQDALLRHELAHAYLMAGDLDHTERECDEVAERLFGDPIYYDRDDVQTIREEAAVHRRRPTYLPSGKEDS